MIRPILIAVVICLLQLSGIQSFPLYIEDFVCLEHDKNYFSHVETYISDDSRNALIGNSTVVQTIPETFTCRFCMMGSLMGEYTLPTGLDYNFPICDMMAETVVVGPLFKSFGYDKCPIPPGIYGNEVFVSSDLLSLPDQFPPNKYVAFIEILDGDKKIFVLGVYLEIPLN